MSEAETQEAPKASRRNLTDEQVAEIREKRAQVGDNGKPVYSHAALGEMFGVKAGTISSIVRNLAYKDPNYTPVNDFDGKPGRGKRA